MSTTFHRLFTAAAVAGALAGAAVMGAPTTVSADTDGMSLAVSCRDGSCNSSDPEAEVNAGPAFTLRRPGGSPAAWRWNRGDPRERFAPQGSAPERLAAQGMSPARFAPQGSAPERLAPAAPPARRSALAGGPQRGYQAYGAYGVKKFSKDTVCSTNDASGNVALACDNDVTNHLWIAVRQWGPGNQVNIAIFFQNISQLGVSGSGNPTNTAADNQIAANLTQTNQDY